MARRLSAWDPVATWDGRCTTGMGSCAPEQLQAVCLQNMEAKEGDIRINREDDDARRTPIGAAQYHYMDVWSPPPRRRTVGETVSLPSIPWKENKPRRKRNGVRK